MTTKKMSDVFILEFLADSELDTNDVVGCTGIDLEIPPVLDPCIELPDIC